MLHRFLGRGLCRFSGPLLTVALVLSACSHGSVAGGGTSPAASGSPSARPIVLTDDERVKVTLPHPARRIVTFAPANTEILFALGLGRDVVGVSGQYDNFPPAAKRIEQVGGASGVQPNLEKVVALHPDLLLATGGGEAWKARLRQLGVPVFTINATSLADALHDIRTVGELTGTEAAARRLTSRMAGEANAIESRVAAEPRVSCFYEVYFQPPVIYTVGPGSFTFDLLEKAGCDPITSGLHQAYPALSEEKVLADDPAVYLVDSLAAPSAGAVAKRRGFDALSAVRGHHVIVIDSDLVTRPGPRVVRGLRELAEALHPKAFG